MKKLLFIITLLIVAIAAQAQKIKPSQMDTNTKNAFKVALGIDAKADSDWVKNNFIPNVSIDGNSYYIQSQVDSVVAKAKYSQYDIAIKALTGTTYIKPFAGTNVLSGNSALSDGYMYYNLAIVFDTVTVSHMETMMSTAGSYNADNYNGMAIMKLNTSTFSYDSIVTTPNDGNIWKATANTAIVKTIRTTTLTPGLYALCAIWNTSDASPATVPRIMTFGSIVSFTYLMHGNHFVCGAKSSIASVPATQLESGLAAWGNVSGIIAY